MAKKKRGTEAQSDIGTEEKTLKQGEVESMTEEVQEFKTAPVIHKTSTITMRNGKPTQVFFGENGKEVGSEVMD